MLLAKEDKKTSSNSRTRIRKAIAEYPTMKFSFEEMPKAFLVSLSYDKQLQNTKTAVNDPENVTERASLLVIEIKKQSLYNNIRISRKIKYNKDDGS